MLLTKELNKLSTMDFQSRMEDPESLAHTLSKLVTLLKELVALAKYHNIEDHLYFYSWTSSDIQPTRCCCHLKDFTDHNGFFQNCQHRAMAHFSSILTVRALLKIPKMLISTPSHIIINHR